MLRMRDPIVPLLVGLILTSCALLVPGPAAGYVVVVVDGHRPLMSADASLAAAGVVLATLLLPLFALSLDAGHTRDAKLGMDQLHLTSPASSAVVAAGRLCANTLFALAVAVLSLLVIASTVSARSLGVPSLSAAGVFLLIVAPVALAAVLLGAMLDRYLGERSGTRTIVAIGIWFSAMIVAILSPWDLVGVNYLREAAAPGARTSTMAVGIITDRGLPTIPWTSAPLTPDLLRDRLTLLALLALGTVVLVPILRRDIVARSAPRLTKWAESSAAPLRIPPGRHPPVAAVGMVRLVAILVMRWMARSRAVVAVTLIALLLAVHGGSTTGAALATALIIVPVVLSRTSARELRVAATLESTTAALHRPSPMLTSCWALALLALGAASPVLPRVPAIQAATAILGILSTTMWLTWTHRCVARPVLGVSTFGLIWYASVFNHPAPALDLFGLWQADLGALGLAATTAGITSALVARHDRLGTVPQGRPE